MVNVTIYSIHTDPSWDRHCNIETGHISSRWDQIGSDVTKMSHQAAEPYGHTSGDLTRKTHFSSPITYWCVSRTEWMGCWGLLGLFSWLWIGSFPKIPYVNSTSEIKGNSEQYPKIAAKLRHQPQRRLAKIPTYSGVSLTLWLLNSPGHWLTWGSSSGGILNLPISSLFLQNCAEYRVTSLVLYRMRGQHRLKIW